MDRHWNHLVGNLSQSVGTLFGVGRGVTDLYLEKIVRGLGALSPTRPVAVLVARFLSCDPSKYLQATQCMVYKYIRKQS